MGVGELQREVREFYGGAGGRLEQMIEMFYIMIMVVVI